MARWQDKMNASKGLPSTRISRNGQVVISARARRAVGLVPGDLVVTVPVARGVILVERVRTADTADMRKQYEDPGNPLRGLWGPDPDAWLDQLRGEWADRGGS